MMCERCHVSNSLEPELHIFSVHLPFDLSRKIKERCTIGDRWVHNRRPNHTRRRDCEVISYADISPQAIYFCSLRARTKNIISSLLMFLNFLSSSLTFRYLSSVNYSSELLLCDISVCQLENGGLYYAVPITNRKVFLQDPNTGLSVFCNGA